MSSIPQSPSPSPAQTNRLMRPLPLGSTSTSTREKSLKAPNVDTEEYAFVRESLDRQRQRAASVPIAESRAPPAQRPSKIPRPIPRSGLPTASSDQIPISKMPVMRAFLQPSVPTYIDMILYPIAFLLFIYHIELPLILGFLSVVLFVFTVVYVGWVMYCALKNWILGFGDWMDSFIELIRGWRAGSEEAWEGR